MKSSTPKSRKAIRRMSEKRFAQLGGKAFSTIVAKPRRQSVKRKPRSPEEYARIYGSKARVAFVKSLGCVYCTALSPFFGLATAGRSDNAHTVSGGKGRKADYTTIIPLCRNHHRMYDEHRGPLANQTVRDVMKSAAAEVERMWLAHSLGRA